MTTQCTCTCTLAHTYPTWLTSYHTIHCIEQVESYHINGAYFLDNSVIVDFFVQFCEKEFSTENVEVSR